MKNLILFTFAFLFLALSCTKDNDLIDEIRDMEEETQEEKTFEGSITLSSQSEVEAWGAEQYTNISRGTLHITSGDASDPIVDLSSLEHLREIDGYLEIINTDLTTLKGLNNLKYVAVLLSIKENALLQHLDDLEKLERVAFHFEIRSNNSLVSIDGMSSLKNIEGAFVVSNNPELQVIEGLNNLVAADGNLGCNITGNEKLIRISGFNKLSYGGLGISGNPLLTKIDGFQQFNDYGVSFDLNESLVTIEGFDSYTNGGLFIKDNPQLKNFPAFSRLTTISDLWIEDNDQLESLEDLESLSSVEHLFIKDNYKLTNYCALTDAMVNIDPNSFGLYSNVFNPTLQDFQNGDCQD